MFDQDIASIDHAYFRVTIIQTAFIDYVIEVVLINILILKAIDSR